MAFTAAPDSILAPACKLAGHVALTSPDPSSSGLAPSGCIEINIPQGRWPAPLQGAPLTHAAPYMLQLLLVFQKRLLIFSIKVFYLLLDLLQPASPSGCSHYR